MYLELFSLKNTGLFKAYMQVLKGLEFLNGSLKLLLTVAYFSS